jgi:hypothetical protein
MKASIIVLLVLSKGEVQDPGMVSMTRAAERALGADSRIFVHEPPGPLSDGEAVSLGEQIRASAIVEVRWGGADRTLAHLHVHVADGAGWFDRDLPFAASAPYTERGRTLGLQIATMVPDTPPEPPPPAPAPAPEQSDRPAPSVAGPAEKGAPRPWALDLSAIGSAGSEATGFGAALGFRYSPVPFVAVRAGAGGRFGEIAKASASSREIHGSLGAFVGVLRDPRVWSLGLRADLLVVHQSLSRADPNGTAIRTVTRVVPGADLVAELGLAVTAQARFVAAAGTEYAFGATDVYVGQDRVATIERLRAVGELGLRLEF